MPTYNDRYAGSSGNPQGFSTDNAPVIAASDNETLPTSDTPAKRVSGHGDGTMYRGQATDPGRVEMLTRAKSISDRRFHSGLDDARPDMCGDIDADVLGGVRETETDRRRLRQRLGADLADHLTIVDDVVAEEEHDLTRQVRTVPPPAGNSSRSMRPDRRRADHQTQITTQRTHRARVVDTRAAIAHSPTFTGTVCFAESSVIAETGSMATGP